MKDTPKPPILDNKDPQKPSVFSPSALLREARRQKGLRQIPVPAACVLDPDGDILRKLKRDGHAQLSESWSCYHTELFVFSLKGRPVGIIGCAVGAPFAVLVAEQLFACGCRMLINLTSAGQIGGGGKPPYFIVIDRALRDEGTSYHYATPAEFAYADPALIASTAGALLDGPLSIVVGSSWTTDAPFRETQDAIDAARAKGILAVEMEAAALYAYAAAARVDVLCIAHVTNTMGQSGDDFEKGLEHGADDALDVLSAAFDACAQ